MLATTVFAMPESSGTLFLTFVVVIILFLIATRLFDQETYTAENASDIFSDRGDFYEDPDLINEIREVTSVEQLMEIVDDELNNDTELCGEENNVLMAKASSFEKDLCRHDWADIYYIAEEGSMLEKVAQEKAGRALEEEEF